MPDYGDHKYWDTRYKTSIASIPIFDWYNDYDAFKTVLAPLLKRKEVVYSRIGRPNPYILDKTSSKRFEYEIVNKLFHL